VNPEVADSGEKPPGSEDLETEMDDDLARERPVWELGLGLAMMFGVPGLLLLGWRASRRENEPSWSAGSARFRRRGDYLDDFLTKCGKRGAKLLPGRTLRCLVEDLEERPEFVGELVRYHYAVSYEGSARDARAEKKFAREIEEWE
jgi:hypothetical protein